MAEVTVHHAALAAGRWQTLTAVEQLGNIGSEVGRAIRAKTLGNEHRMWSALERGLDLFDLTAADPHWRGERLRELLRAREVVCDYLVGDNQYGCTGEDLEAYFMTFALAARSRTSVAEEQRP